MNWQDEVKANVSLARYNTWRVGGAAEWLFTPNDAEHLIEFLKVFPEDKDITWLGLGSNILVRDGGIKGVVIQTHVGLNQLEERNGFIVIDAGMTCAKAARQLVKRGYCGGEFFVGIPGTIGGALVMNAGAFGGETWSHVQAVDVLTRSGEVVYKEKDEFDVSYRTVKGLLANEWILRGYFDYPKGEPEISSSKMKSLLKLRSDTQPIGKPSCGSVFRNPPGDHAARLIEACGLKGKQIGDAMISPKHANFIVHGGKAKARDIEQLIELAHERVFEKFNIALEKEVHIKGHKEG